MLEYADYEFYSNTYKGTLNIDLFNSLIPKASHEIDKAVNRELKEVDINDKIRFVACEMVDYLKSKENGNVSSVSIDGVSKTYKTNTEIKQNKQDILNGLPHDLIRFL